MPYSEIGDLPQDIQSQYNPTQLQAFLSAFNSAMQQGQDESSAFAIAHDSAQGAKAHYWFKSIGEMWIGYYTNAYKDRDGEYFPEDEIERDVKRMAETGEYPPLLYGHIPWAKIGQAQTCIKTGRFGVAIGTWDTDEFSQTIKRHVENNPDYGMSFGFEYPPDKKQGNAFYNFKTFEVSILPLEDAANSFTQFIVETKGFEDMNPTDKATEQIRNILKGLGITDADGAIAQRIEQAGKAATQAADVATNRDYKAETPAEVVEEEGNEDKVEVEINPAMKTYMDKRIGELEMKMADVVKAMMSDYEVKMQDLMKSLPSAQSQQEETIKAVKELIETLQPPTMQGARAAQLLQEQFETVTHQNQYKTLEKDGIDVGFFEWATGQKVAGAK